MPVEPNYAFAKGHGRFSMGYTRLATALGNFEQGNIQAEGTVVAQWLTFGLRVAMSCTGWNLLSPRCTLTKIPSTLLSNYHCNGYPLSPKMEDRPYNQYGQCLCTEDRWDQLCAWLTGNPTFLFRSLWLKTYRLKALSNNLLSEEVQRLLLKEKKLSPGRYA